MPSNRELAARALELGRELGEKVDTVGLNNAKLTELVESLEAKASGPETTEPEPESAPTVQEAAPAPPEPSPSPPDESPAAASYAVAKGRGVSTISRGVLGEGELVRENDFPGGSKRIGELAAAGYLVVK